METSSVIMGILLLLLFVGPMIYLIIFQKSMEKTQRKNLMLLSQKNGIDLTETDFLTSVSLGLDKNTRKLVAIQQAKPRREVVIDLKEFKSCKLQQITADQDLAPSLDTIEEISLLLNRATGPEVKIFFYQDENDSAIEKESLLSAARKWQDLAMEFIDQGKEHKA